MQCRKVVFVGRFSCTVRKIRRSRLQFRSTCLFFDTSIERVVNNFDLLKCSQRRLKYYTLSRGFDIKHGCKKMTKGAITLSLLQLNRRIEFVLKK